MADDSYHVVNKQSRHREAEKRHREKLQKLTVELENILSPDQTLRKSDMIAMAIANIRYLRSENLSLRNYVESLHGEKNISYTKLSLEYPSKYTLPGSTVPDNSLSSSSATSSKRKKSNPKLEINSSITGSSTVTNTVMTTEPIAATNFSGSDDDMIDEDDDNSAESYESLSENEEDDNNNNNEEMIIEEDINKLTDDGLAKDTVYSTEETNSVVSKVKRSRKNVRYSISSEDHDNTLSTNSSNLGTNENSPSNSHVPLNITLDTIPEESKPDETTSRRILTRNRATKEKVKDFLSTENTTVSGDDITIPEMEARNYIRQNLSSFVETLNDNSKKRKRYRGAGIPVVMKHIPKCSQTKTFIPKSNYLSSSTTSASSSSSSLKPRNIETKEVDRVHSSKVSANNDSKTSLTSSTVPFLVHPVATNTSVPYDMEIPNNSNQSAVHYPSPTGSIISGIPNSLLYRPNIMGFPYANVMYPPHPSLLSSSTYSNNSSNVGTPVSGLNNELYDSFPPNPYFPTAFSSNFFPSMFPRPFNNSLPEPLRSMSMFPSMYNTMDINNTNSANNSNNNNPSTFNNGYPLISSNASSTIPRMFGGPNNNTAALMHPSFSTNFPPVKSDNNSTNTTAISSSGNNGSNSSGNNNNNSSVRSVDVLLVSSEFLIPGSGNHLNTNHDETNSATISTDNINNNDINTPAELPTNSCNTVIQTDNIVIDNHGNKDPTDSNYSDISEKHENITTNVTTDPSALETTTNI